MAKWKIEPTVKKSVIDFDYYVNGNNKLQVETGWRWGSFYVYTKDDNPPVFDPEVSIYNQGYEVELIETTDGCWTENDYSECDQEAREFLSEFLEDNDIFDLENEGWELTDSETFITCDLDIEMVEG